ncbi:TVB4 protein, partial [Xiphorhynchus elegans]|nr:TVB4 protein [Xiphorhynchus elegans]
MWTAWCVAMCFFGARAAITQTPSLVLREDEKATLKCSQNDKHYSMYWYMQKPGKGLELIYYSVSEHQKQEGDIANGFQADR